MKNIPRSSAAQALALPEQHDRRERSTRQTPGHLVASCCAQLRQPSVQWLVVLLLSALVAFSVGGGVLIASHPAFARSMSKLSLGIGMAGTPTCAQAATAADCNLQDPIEQGCTADASTVDSVPMLYQGNRVGLFELRSSARCHSYWGRCFALSDGFANIYMDAPYTENVSGQFEGPYAAAYTDMVYGDTPPLLECIVGLDATHQVKEQLAG